MTDSEMLVAARTLIADPAHWCQGDYARDAEGYGVSFTDPKAVSYCAAGAVFKHGQGLEAGSDGDRVADYLYMASESVLPEERKKNQSIVYVNDYMGHEATLRMFDVAIALAKEREVPSLNAESL